MTTETAPDPIIHDWSNDLEQDLVETGMEQPQAKAFARAFELGMLRVLSVVSTKQEALQTKQELRDEIERLRTELKDEIASLRTELKDEIASVRTELKGEIASLRTEFKGQLKDEIANLRREMRFQFILLAGLMAGLMGGIIAKL